MNPLSGLHDFVDGLPADVRSALDTVSTYRNIPVGGKLLRAGALPKEVYQILEGRVRYSAWDHRGCETVLTYMSRGDWAGLSEVFTGMSAQWNVVAQSAVRVRVIRRRDFEKLVDTHPALAKQLLRIFALRFSLYRLFGFDHSALTLKERVVKMLWFLSFGHDKQADDGAPITLKISQEELGKVVGASRQKLNPALKVLEKENLLTVKFGSVTLHSRASICEHYGHLLDTGS